MRNIILISRFIWRIVMRKSFYVFKLISLLFVSLYLHAHPVMVNDIKSYQAEYEFYSIDESGHTVKAGTWSDQVSFKDNSIIRTVTRRNIDGAIDLMRTVGAELEGLNPKFIQQRFGKDLQSLLYTSFKGTQLSQLYLADGGSQAIQNVTDFGLMPIENNLQGLLAVALQFKGERKLMFDGYDLGATPKVKQLTFEKLGEEIITTHGKKYTTTKITEPVSQWTYWVSRELPYLIKVTHPAPDGSTLVSEVKSFSLSK